MDLKIKLHFTDEEFNILHNCIKLCQQIQSVCGELDNEPTNAATEVIEKITELEKYTQ